MHKRPTVAAQGGGGDKLFDWVSFALRDPPPANAPLPRRGKDGFPLPSFPAAMWNTTLQWAADWVAYVAALEAHGADPFCIPGVTTRGGLKPAYSALLLAPAAVSDPCSPYALCSLRSLLPALCSLRSAPCGRCSLRSLL